MDFTGSSGVWLQQLWPLAALAVVVGAFVRRGARRRVDAQLRANERAAAGQGLSYRAPGGEGALIDEGVHHYGGCTHGIDWTAEVLVLAGQHHVDPDRQHLGRVPYTRWTAAACGTASTGGGALALMSAPAVPATGPRSPNPGWLEGLQARAGGLALQAWLALSFGPARVRALSLSPAQACALDEAADTGAAQGFSQGWRAFTDRAALLERLTPEARGWLMRARDRKLQLLWDDKGLTLMWPTGQGSPEQVQTCADYGTTLCRLLRSSATATPQDQENR